MDSNAKIASISCRTIVGLESIQIRCIVRRGLRMKKCSNPLGCSYSSRIGRSGIRLWIRASKLPSSTRPTKLQLVT
jgi:hypothetical protein